MIQKFVNRFMAAESVVRESLAKQQPESYDELVRSVVLLVGDSTDYPPPDPDRITVIDHGDYQGFRLYIIGEAGYQPVVYWVIGVDYGSCSGCDTFQAIQSYSDEPPTQKQIDSYWTLMLHMVQSMKQITGHEELE